METSAGAHERATLAGAGSILPAIIVSTSMPPGDSMTMLSLNRLIYSGCTALVALALVACSKQEAAPAASDNPVAGDADAQRLLHRAAAAA